MWTDRLRPVHLRGRRVNAPVRDAQAHPPDVQVPNLERLFTTYPGDRQALERAAAQVAAHLRAEIDRRRLPAPEAVRHFLTRHGA